MQRDFIPESLTVESIATPELRPVVSTYLKRAYQMAGLCSLPVNLYHLGRMHQKLECAASIKLFGKPFLCSIMPSILMGWPDHAERKEFLKAAELHGEKIAKHRNLYIDLLSGKATCPTPVGGTSILHADIYNYSGDEEQSQYENLISMQFVNSWTVLEALAGDLWEAAINAHPKILGTLSSGQSTLHHKEQSKQIDVKYLEMHNYNLTNKMGTIHKNRIKFATLNQIIKAYQQAFPKRSMLGGEEFWKNADVISVCAIRNVIVHSAGVIDEDFLNRRGSDMKLSHYQMGDQLVWDGAEARLWLKGLFDFTSSLIRHVDDWIVANAT